ncbi:hypothetical protein HPB47_006286 [Ixodes persulcatus]|uniref:Uncharacterized protein n=1 Tax=Ixodes persulcatus TaxID=34615 RepID=A0AC60PAQ1_IXOPE|nr:hypothetical protein HPB47_006286 [Ixodes persulcatus]
MNGVEDANAWQPGNTDQVVQLVLPPLCRWSNPPCHQSRLVCRLLLSHDLGLWADRVCSAAVKLAPMNGFCYKGRKG